MPRETYKLNAAQSEILLSESVSEGSAVNTVSVRLEIEGFGAEEVKSAADLVILSADVFAVRFSDGAFVPCDPVGSVLKEPMTREELDAYAEERNRERIPLSGPLYSVEVIPLGERVAVYARFHHLLLDGKGMSLFAQRVLDVLSGKELPRSVFFKEDGTENGGEDGDGYWREALADAPETAIFPDPPKEGSLSLRCDFSQEILNGAARFAKAHGVSLPYVFMAAEALYLAKATNSGEATILMPRRNRKKEEADVLGCYMLLVPVRIRTEGTATFSELALRAQELSREASRHKTGFSKIMRETGAKHPLSQYGFNYYDYPTVSPIAHTVSFSVAGALTSHLVWILFVGEKGVQCSFDCRPGVYDRERAEFFFEGLSSVLSEGLSGRPLGEIGIVGGREREKLEAVHGAQTSLDEGETIPSMLRAAARKYGAAPAVYAGEDALTFEELDRCSDDIARALVARGVRSGDRVAFKLRRDIRLLPALFGISKSGAAFIPIDPAYPKERIDYILEDSAAAFLITSADIGEGLDIGELMKGADVPLPEVKQSATAYLIYTSGTTGKPKGVMLSHRGIANIVKPWNNPFNRFFTGHCKGLAAIGSVCFDISLFEFFTSLFNGKFVELADEKGMIDPVRLSETISAHGADALHCTPSRLASYLRDPDFAATIPGVKAVLSAGEVLPQALISALKEFGVRIFNGYGPTETTIGATITEEGDSLSIGKPIANMGVLILGKDGTMLPYGAPGEICVYGVGLGQGYHGRPEETEAHFTQLCGRSVYRTGDMGRLLADGRIVYLGRSDRQVKLRGLRIELNEIESAMLSCPGVGQAACLVKKSDHSEHLAAFYTAERDLGPELKAHISRTLTAYMVPDIFKRLPAMPQTAGGKTDYRKLEEENVQFGGEYRAPANETERIICEAISSVLGVERVGADDDFFELGGNSLGAMELMLAIERSYHGNAPEYNDIYRYPTPARLAAKLEEGGASEAYPISALDFSGIDGYLEKRTVSQKPIKRILLTGATGFLGCHILAELLKRKDCEKIYCLARSKKKMSAGRRIGSTLFYYLEDDFSEGGKWQAVEGDISDPKLFSEPFGEQVDLIVNCAANVAHFAYGDALTRVNETGVVNLIAYAKRTGARFCQISTVSVGGMTSGQSGKFTEDRLYIGQKIFNEYIYTKFKAEHALLRAAADAGLEVQIMRVGNLQGRLSDGEFQMNMRTNGFTRRLASYIDIGAVPQSLYDSSVEFSPVDEVARMVTALIACGELGAFHVCPPAETAFSRLFDALNKMGKHVEVLPDEAFERLISSLKRSGEHSDSVEMLSIEKNRGQFREIPFSRDYTVERLASLGCSWREITDEYFKKYLSALDGLDMF